jgi:hypothetical protein
MALNDLILLNYEQGERFLGRLTKVESTSQVRLVPVIPSQRSLGAIVARATTRLLTLITRGLL